MRIFVIVLYEAKTYHEDIILRDPGYSLLLLSLIIYFLKF